MLALGLAFILGGAAVLGFAPFALFPFGLLSLAGLVLLWNHCRGVGQAFALGFSWGLGLFLGGVSWLYVALNRYGGMPMPLAALAILAFCSYLALYPAFAGALYRRLRCDRAWLDALLLGALWCLQEWLRGWLFTGFPWLALGYTQTPPSPLAGFFPIVGVFGVSALLGFLASMLASAWSAAGARAAFGAIRAVAAVVLVSALGWGGGRIAWVEPEGTPFEATLLQTNVDQGEKFDPSLLSRWLDLNLRMVAAHPGKLVVLPEGALPVILDQVAPAYLQALGAPVAAVGGNLVTGVFVRDQVGAIHNAAVSLGDGPVQQYAKHHLVPFGEYSPPMFGWLFQWLRIPMSNQTPGAAIQPPMRLDGQKIAINICYEDVFGEELIRALPGAGAMLNLSNLAWYGNSFAQPQHLQMSQARALETGRPMLRATNTGMTALVEPNGRVAASLPPFTRGALQVEVQPYGGLTPYARWGNWGAIGLCSAIMFGLWWHRGRAQAKMQGELKTV